MTDVKKLSGGAPVDSTILVNVDHVTIDGDGSENHPLRAIGGVGGGLPVAATQKPVHAGTVPLAAGHTNVVDLTNGGIVALDFPKANSVANGTLLAFVGINPQTGAGNGFQYSAASGDTLSLVGLTGETTFSGELFVNQFTSLFVSDGVSTWWELL